MGLVANGLPMRPGPNGLLRGGEQDTAEGFMEPELLELWKKGLPSRPGPNGLLTLEGLSKERFDENDLF